MTIFKKTFILLLLSFIFVNVLNVYLDFMSSRDRVLETVGTTVDKDKLMKLSADYSQNHYQLDSQGFYKTLEQYINKESLKQLYILDPDFNIRQKIYNQSGDFNYLGFMHKYHLENNSEVSILIYVEFDKYHIKNKDIMKADNIIKDYQQRNEDIPLKYSVDKNQKVLYLELDGIVLINSKNTNAKETSLLVYESEMLKYDIRPEDIVESPESVSYEEIENDLTKQLSKNKEKDIVTIQEDDDHTTLYGIENRFIASDHMYYYYLVPLLKEGVQYKIDRYYSIDSIEGYILSYECKVDAIPEIMNSVILDKYLVYISSFVVIIIVCLIISYTFSRRIKLIDKEAQKIANNDFDVKLKEKPNDELGTLSHSINDMSQQLKSTIDHLNEEIERVKKLESVRQEFIANFTHEIKTPLSIINGYIELINETVNEDKKEEYLEAIEQETNKINQLVLAMLNLSRLESGKVELKKKDIDIDELITSVLDHLTSLLQKKNIQVHIQSDSSMINADEEEMSVVIENIMSNAVKHTPVGGHIYLNVDEQVLTIENEGKHLTNQQIETLWDTYVSNDRDGTGLGLAICKSILDLHGFQYNAKNSEKGVKFIVKCKKTS